MSEASLALQVAIRARLIGDAAVLALVPADHVLDRNQRPAPDPSIVLGEDQVINSGETVARDLVRVYSTIHIWKREPSLAGVKAIGGAATRALTPRLQLTDPNYQCADNHVEGFRVMRDPDGETSHGVLTLASLLRALP